jgi:hypothetical protein
MKVQQSIKYYNVKEVLQVLKKKEVIQDYSLTTRNQQNLHVEMQM